MKHKRNSKRLWGVMLILAMAMVMMLGATVTASAAGVTDEAYDTKSRQQIYLGNNFYISVKAVGDGAGFYLESPKGHTATFQTLHGEIITKVELQRGWQDIKRVTTDKGTITFNGDYATINDVDATSLTLGATAVVQVKWVKVYYKTIDNYPIWVGGKQVTSENMDDVFNDGRVSYIPANDGADPPQPATLKLNKANIITGHYISNALYGIYYTGNEGLTIELSPDTDNKVELDADKSVGIYSESPVTITGTGSLTANGMDGGIMVGNDGSITIGESTVAASGSEKAVGGTVKNSIAGSGWTDAAGTEGKEKIEIDLEGKSLDFKKVQFPEVPDPDPEPAVDPVQRVVNLINGLPTLGAVEDAVKAARAAYENLTDEQKQDPQLTDKVLNKLAELEAALMSLEDKDAAGKVSEMIAAIPDDPSTATSDQVSAAVEAYNKLNAAQKKLITSSDFYQYFGNSDTWVFIGFPESMLARYPNHSRKSFTILSLDPITVPSDLGEWCRKIGVKDLTVKAPMTDDQKADILRQFPTAVVVQL